MVYLNSVLNFKFCPYCGKEILGEEGINPCEHLVSVFVYQSSASDGCLFMSESMRQKYYPKYKIEYTPDAVMTKVIGKSKIRQIVKENNYVVFDLRSKESDMYEWPILKYIFQEPDNL